MEWSIKGVIGKTKYRNQELSENVIGNGYMFPDSWPKFEAAAAAAAKSLQSCPTLCSPIDGSPPDSPVPGIFQARTLGWVAISLSNVWKWKVKGKSLSHVQFLATPWTAAYQAPPSMGFSKQAHWSGVPLPSPKIWRQGLKKTLGTQVQKDSFPLFVFHSFKTETNYFPGTKLKNNYF